MKHALLAVGSLLLLALVVAGPWMLSELLEFTTAAFRAMGSIHP